MNRREALSAVAVLLGGTIISTDVFLTGCKPAGKKHKDLVFAPEDVAYLDEIAETILPATSTPGAKAAAVGTFMTVMINDCYTPEDQKVFFEGMDKLDEACDKKYNKRFMEADANQRKELLTALDKEQKEYKTNKKDGDPNHYFAIMKELTLLGYFTSEVGATKALRYVAVPGRFEGDIPYKKGDRAWALS